MNLFFKFLLTFLSPIVFLSMSCASTYAKPIVADLAVHSIDIEHDFSGLDVLMFGARSDVGRIIVVLRGPEKKFMIRKKERIAGVWVNSKSAELEGVNSFYSMAATNPFSDIRNDQLLSSLGIGVENISMNTSYKEKDINEFKQALIKNKEKSGLYVKKVGKVTFWGETLFRTILKFPKNIERGWYTAEVYLFSDGALTAVQSTPVLVRKTGFEALVYDFAYSHKLAYGCVCVALAVFAGWSANVLLRRI